MRHQWHYALPFAMMLAVNAFSYDINVPVHYDTLGNGMRIIVVPDTNVAVVSCRLYYFVGSMYEQFSRSGLSHMYEHMMFKGTHRLNTKDFQKESVWLGKIDSVDKIIFAQKSRGVSDTAPATVKLRREIVGYMDKERPYIKKDEIWQLYMGNGGTNLNAWTADDMTAYIVTLPKNKVELFYWIESDRMAHPVFREFYSERQVVLEERRMRYENQPANRFYEYLNSLFYIAHPYRLPTIGWKSDIENYTIQDLAGHVKQFYTPDNAVIVMVGNIDPVKAVSDIKRYFGSIPRAATPKQEVVTREPVPMARRVSRYTTTRSRASTSCSTPRATAALTCTSSTCSNRCSPAEAGAFSTGLSTEKTCAPTRKRPTHSGCRTGISKFPRSSRRTRTRPRSNRSSRRNLPP